MWVIDPVEWELISDLTEIPEDHVLLFSKDLIDPVFYPEGVVEGYHDEDKGWVAAIYCATHDTWHSKVVKPTHWMPKPEGPLR